MQNLNSIGENHVPVLLKETLEALKVDEIAHSKEALQGAPERSSGRRGRFIDATLGLGGHTQAIVKLGGHVLGIEQDSESLEVAKKKLRDLEKIAHENSFREVDGILFDLGISSYQLEKDRGFSFCDTDTSLDMRI